MFFFLNLATLYQRITKEGRQEGGTGPRQSRPGAGRRRAPGLAGTPPQAHPRPAQPTYLFSWRPNSALGARKTLAGREQAGKVGDFSSQNPSPPSARHSPAPSQATPRLQALLADRQHEAALSGHSGPELCPPAPTAHEPAPLTHLGTWVALLPRGAGLSLGTLQETQAGTDGGCGALEPRWEARPGAPSWCGRGRGHPGGT